MKGRQIVLDALGGRPAAALLSDGRLDDLLTDPRTALAPGAILRGTVDRAVKGGAFVTLPEGQGYLRGGGNLKPGRSVLVQVSSHPEPGKAAPLTNRLVFKGRTVIITPGAEGMNLSRQIKGEKERARLLSALDTAASAETAHGIVVRTAATHADTIEIAQEVDQRLAQADQVLAAMTGAPDVMVPAPNAHDLARREWLAVGDDLVAQAGAFDTLGITDAIEALRRIEAPLPNGSMTVEPTRALVAVDVNTGADFSPAAGLKANLAAARELPRQLRLRGLGGQIVIDFAPMPKKDRRTLEEALGKAFRADPVDTSLVGWTTLGHYEMQRKRERRPLHEVL